jgi:hypothetical protein
VAKLHLSLQVRLKDRLRDTVNVKKRPIIMTPVNGLNGRQSPS